MAARLLMQRVSSDSSGLLNGLCTNPCPLFLQRAITPVAASALAASILLYPTRTLHAESPLSAPTTTTSVTATAQQLSHSQSKSSGRKSIYSDIPPGPLPHHQAATHSTIDPPQIHQPTTLRPTPTDHLASYIRLARLHTHNYATVLETQINALLSTILSHERSLASTLTSLRPPPEIAHNEDLLPGTIYTLVATLSGTILSRNRTILLRSTLPLALGVGTAWIVLPHTMRNVSQLVWEWEVERVPGVAENHMRVRGAVEEGLRWGEERGRMVKGWLVERDGGVVGRAREGVEGWVRGK